MAGITLAQAQAQLDTWLAASTAVSKGQEYQVGDRRLKRADLEFINKSIEMWDNRVKQLSRGGGMRVRYGVPN